MHRYQKIRLWRLRACLLAGLSAVSVAASVAVAGVFYPDGATMLHFAFEGSPSGDRPIVRPPAFYHPEDGFGFVDSPDLIGTSRGVTAPKHFRFDVNLPPGDYDVSVTIGNDQKESTTTVKAEGLATPAVNVHAATGQRAQPVIRSFAAKVKPGALVKEGPAAPLESDGRLNLEFDGINPSLMKLDIKPHGASGAAPPAKSAAKAESKPSTAAQAAPARTANP